MDLFKKSMVAALAAVVPVSVSLAQGSDNSTQNQVMSVGVALHDKEAYLDQQYSPHMLRKNIFEAVVQGGAKPVAFKRLSFTSKTLIDKVGAAIPTSYDTDMVYEDAGNGLVKQFNVTKANGFEQSTFFALSYRGLLDFRWQTISASASAMPQFNEAQSLTHFDAAIESPRFSYSALQPSAAPGAPPVEVRYECVAGASYPASQLNPGIQGSAHDLDCQSMNANGIATSMSRFSYLEKYGLAIQVHYKSGTGETSVTVTGFKEG